MSNVSFAMAKLSGIKKSVENLLRVGSASTRPARYYAPEIVGHYFVQTIANIAKLRAELPDLYDDFQSLEIKPQLESPSADPTATNVFWYSKSQVEHLVRDIEQIFEIRANSELEQPKHTAHPKRVFITHGQAQDWREVQAYIEKDLRLNTIELAQEPNHGQTIIEKLFDGAEKCDAAVIIMTGDDKDDSGKSRARENVMHEIGFFQGRYGRGRTILMHEEGVSIPSNLSGVVYIPFPKGSISSGFHVMARDLKSIYGM